MATDHLSTAGIFEAFKEEVLALGGRVTDAFDDGRRLYTRSILPGVREVRPNDRMNGGVALRATEEDVWIHPYLFRQVCKNGAIKAQSVETRHVRIATAPSREEAEWTVRAAIRACADPEVFAVSVHEMRSTLDVQADYAIAMMPSLSRMGRHANGRVFADILDRFYQGGDHSVFGWMNAITAQARDTEDPEQRWRLEVAGGGVPALLRSDPRPPLSEAEPLVYERELQGVA